MEAAIGLVGVALGALLAPALDWARQSRRVREERPRELLEATDGFVAASGDALQAEWGTDSDQDAWKSGVGFRANAARWRLALLAPEAVARAAHAFADATDRLGKRHKQGGASPTPAGTVRQVMAHGPLHPANSLERQRADRAPTRQIRVTGEDRAVGYSDDAITPVAPTPCSPQSSACSR